MNYDIFKAAQNPTAFPQTIKSPLAQPQSQTQKMSPKGGLLGGLKSTLSSPTQSKTSAMKGLFNEFKTMLGSTPQANGNQFSAQFNASTNQLHVKLPAGEQFANLYYDKSSAAQVIQTQSGRTYHVKLEQNSPAAYSPYAPPAYPPPAQAYSTPNIYQAYPAAPQTPYQAMPQAYPLYAPPAYPSPGKHQTSYAPPAYPPPDTQAHSGIYQAYPAAPQTPYQAMPQAYPLYAPPNHPPPDVSKQSTFNTSFQKTSVSKPPLQTEKVKTEASNKIDEDIESLLHKNSNVSVLERMEKYTELSKQPNLSRNQKIKMQEAMIIIKNELVKNPETSWQDMASISKNDHDDYSLKEKLIAFKNNIEANQGKYGSFNSLILQYCNEGIRLEREREAQSGRESKYTIPEKPKESDQSKNTSKNTDSVILKTSYNKNTSLSLLKSSSQKLNKVTTITSNTSHTQETSLDTVKNKTTTKNSKLDDKNNSSQEKNNNLNESTKNNQEEFIELNKKSNLYPKLSEDEENILSEMLHMKKEDKKTFNEVVQHLSEYSLSAPGSIDINQKTILAGAIKKIYDHEMEQLEPLLAESKNKASKKVHSEVYNESHNEMHNEALIYAKTQVQIEAPNQAKAQAQAAYEAAVMHLRSNGNKTEEQIHSEATQIFNETYNKIYNDIGNKIYSEKYSEKYNEKFIDKNHEKYEDFLKEEKDSIKLPGSSFEKPQTIKSLMLLFHPDKQNKNNPPSDEQKTILTDAQKALGAALENVNSSKK